MPVVLANTTGMAADTSADCDNDDDGGGDENDDDNDDECAGSRVVLED